MDTRFSFFQNIPIFSYLFYIKRRYCKEIESGIKRKVLIKFLKIKRESKNIFFHDKVNLVSELILYSLDLKPSTFSIPKYGSIFKKIVNQDNFLIIQKLGTGTNINLIFCILCKFWVGYNKFNKSLVRQKSSLLCIISKEDRKQFISALLLISNIFYLKIKDDESIQGVLKNKNFLIKVFSNKFSSNIFNPQLGWNVDSIFVKGDCFLPEYHLSFFKMKNLNLFKKKSTQRILMFREKIYGGIFITKCTLPIYLKINDPFIFTDFFCNQILDISANQFGKVHRLVKLVAKLNYKKAIISSSWGRCLLFCKLIIKLIHKIKIKHKNFQIIKIKKKLYLALKFEGNVIYFFCTILKSNIIKKFKVIIFFDIFPKTFVRFFFFH